LVRRFIGPAWALSIAPASSPLAKLDLESVTAEALSGETTANKVWLVRIIREESGPGLVFTGREYDVATRRFGPLQRRAAVARTDAARDMLRFALDLFNPTAEVTGQEGGRALLAVQGAALEPASPVGAVVAPGSVFQPLRLVALKDGHIVVRRLPWSYLLVESVEGPVARCAIISAFHGDPLALSQTATLPFTLAAVGLKPGYSSTRLRFVARDPTRPGPDGKPLQFPAAGYTVTARLLPGGPPHEMGTTDRAGRIVLPPAFADGLVQVRLLAGNVEPMAERPLMPGETAEEREIPFNPLQRTVELEAQLDSLRDEVVDLVALRARLEARMKARFEGEDWAGLEEAVKEFTRLTPRDQLAKRLAELKEAAARRQAESKIPVLTRTAQAQVNDLQALIDRYLEDEAFKAYADALDRRRKTLAANQQAVRKRPAPQAPATRSIATTTPAPAPAASAPPAPRPKPAPAKSDLPF
jgi:hypothetical protein